MKDCKIKSKKKVALLVIALIVLIIGIWTIWGNATIGTTTINIGNANIPASFDGFKIAHISDLHNAEFGVQNEKLIEILRAEHPDLIAITGDLIDSNHTDISIAITFVQQAAQIAPCYFVTGNHEAWLGDKYNDFEVQLANNGVCVLHNQTEVIEKSGSTIQIVGVDDPAFAESSSMFNLAAGVVGTEIDNSRVENGYKILLSHRPEVFSVYSEKKIDLALCGHAHGGQFRLPLIGGLIAPDQGLFPKYDSGVYTEGNTTMIVSRGIGNSVIPIRFNNKPEIVIVVLHSE